MTRPRRFIDSPQDQVFLSIASLWEIAIKVGVNKLELNRSLDELEVLLGRLNITVLTISFDDIKQYLKLPLHHRDPFDRMLIAQAIARALPLVSADAAFDAYPIQRSWV